jgi:hypothetical protein
MRYDEFERLNGGILDLYSDIIVRVDTTTAMDEAWDDLHDRVGELMGRLGGTKG